MRIIEALTKPIAFHPVLVRICGSINAGLFLGQAIYWSTRTTEAGGWFFKVRDEWEEETCLSRREQETAREKLRDAGFIEESRKGIPAKLFFRVNLDAIEAAINDLKSARIPDCQTDGTKAPNKAADAVPTSWHESAQLAGTKQPNRLAQTSPSNIGKSTAETTAETTTPLPPKPTTARTTKAKSEPLPENPPVGLTQETWAAFVQFRVELKKPMTDHAKKLALRELERLAADGNDPNKVIEQSILSGWAGLFQLKGDFQKKFAHDDYQKGIQQRPTTKREETLNELYRGYHTTSDGQLVRNDSPRAAANFGGELFAERVG
jgi:hypothetical protein